MIRLVTLDVTNTLLRFVRPPIYQYAEIAQLYGINPDITELTKSFRSTFKEYDIKHPHFGGKSIGYENWWLGFVADTFKAAGHEASDQTLNKLGSHLIEHFSSADAYTVIDGTLELLSYLEKIPVTVGVISNTDPRIEKVLTQFGIHKNFKFVLTSFTAKSSKPEKEIFSKALVASGTNIEPSEALHIGDTLKLDYLAARTYGWKSLLVSEQLEQQCQKFQVEVNRNSMFYKLTDIVPKIESLL